MRIITGSARGCRLKTPKGLETRPTADRIKESLFSILGDRIPERKVLDVFAGTGGLGLEALSRGASEAVFIDKVTDKLIRDNAIHTHLIDRAEILRGDVFQALQRLSAAGRRFDLVFCDPPYHKGLWERTLVFFDTGRLLLPDAIVVVEHGRDENDVPVLQSFECVRNQGYGATTQLSIFHRKKLYTGGEDINEGCGVLREF
jgi:16S rRNA (guanine966-N2)-methyltransferase